MISAVFTLLMLLTLVLLLWLVVRDVFGVRGPTDFGYEATFTRTSSSDFFSGFAYRVVVRDKKTGRTIVSEKERWNPNIYRERAWARMTARELHQKMMKGEEREEGSTFTL